MVPLALLQLHLVLFLEELSHRHHNQGVQLQCLYQHWVRTWLHILAIQDQHMHQDKYPLLDHMVHHILDTLDQLMVPDCLLQDHNTKVGVL